MFLSAAGVIQVPKMAKCCPQAEERSDTSHYVVTMWSQSRPQVVLLPECCPNGHNSFGLLLCAMMTKNPKP